jgi:hypothetical protein
MEIFMKIKDWLVRSVIFGAAALTVDAVPGWPTDCLAMWHGIYHNNCGVGSTSLANVSLDIPLTLHAPDHVPPKHIYVGTYIPTPSAANGYANIACRGESVSKWLGVAYVPAGGAYSYPSQYPQSQINLYNNIMFTEGALLVNCQVGNDGWVEVVGYENAYGGGYP